jgi:hypothetical protein
VDHGVPERNETENPVVVDVSERNLEEAVETALTADERVDLLEVRRSARRLGASGRTAPIATGPLTT